MSRATSSLIEDIASVSNEKYEARIQQLGETGLQDYINYLISYILAGVGVGIQLVQGQLKEEAAAGGPKPANFVLTPEAVEHFTKHFQKRFAALLPKKAYHVNDNKVAYLWERGIALGQRARRIAQERGAEAVDLESLSEALIGVSEGAIALTKRFNAIRRPLEPLAPFCDPTDPL